MKIMEMLQESKKSVKFLTKRNEEEILQNQLETVLNMRTVKEGTAFAGSFANWLFEIARNNHLNLTMARKLGDLIQQKALDSKHVTGGDGFRDSEWYKIVELKQTDYKSSPEKIEEKIKKILAGEKINKIENYNDEFEL